MLRYLRHQDRLCQSGCHEDLSIRSLILLFDKRSTMIVYWAPHNVYLRFSGPHNKSFIRCQGPLECRIYNDCQRTVSIQSMHLGIFISPAPNYITQFHWMIALFWPIGFDVTIVSIGNNCNVKLDKPESPFGIV